MSEIIDEIDSKGGFSLSKYFELLENDIQKILLRTENDVLHRPKRKMRQTFYKKIKILLFSFLIV